MADTNSKLTIYLIKSGLSADQTMKPGTHGVPDFREVRLRNARRRARGYGYAVTKKRSGTAKVAA